MSKKEKKDSAKSKLTKLKKVIKKLSKFEDVLKSKEKKIDKKLKMSDKLKKSEIKKLMEKFEESEKKSKKIADKIKGKKAEVKKIKKEKRAIKDGKKKTFTDFESSEIDLTVSKDNDQGGSEISNTDETEVKDELVSRSINFNSKDAIAFLRKLTDPKVIDKFLRKDVRTTVKSAARSRKNALIKKQ